MMLCARSHKTTERAKKLLRYVQANNVESMKRLVHKDEDILSFEYASHDNQTVLMIACNDLQGTEGVTKITIETLISLGAKCTQPNKSDGWEAIHYTALNANVKKMEAIVKELSPEELNSLVCISKKRSLFPTRETNRTCSNNALNVLLKCGNRNREFYECCELLIRSGINVGHTDSNGVSPIKIMAAMGDDRMNTVLSDISRTTKFSKAAFEAIKLKEEQRFLQGVGQVEDADGPAEELSSCTLLQLTCMKGLTRCVEFLLSNGADPNRTISKNRKPPIWIAIKKDYEDVVKLFLLNEDLRLPYDVLIKIQMQCRHHKNFSRADKYTELVLKHLQRSRRYGEEELSKYLLHCDDLQRSALHYSTHYRSSETSFKLLRMGASLTQRDIFGHTPMHTMEPKILEKFLDSCVGIPRNEEELNNTLYSLHHKKHKFSLEIDYGPLVNVKHKRFAQESEFLVYLIKLRNMAHLLNHPVVVSYLTLKWQKFKWVVYANLLLYFIAYVSLLFYGFAFTSFSRVSNSFLLASLVLLLLRECVQILIFRKHYIRRIDNVIDLILVAGIIYILASGWIETLLDQNLLVAFSVVFLTSTLGIFVQLENLPIFTVKVIMFKQISINFFKYMLFYMFPLLAFVFCFYMLCESEENLFFQTLYDTLIMFATDSDSNYPRQFQTNPIFSHVVYVVFIMLIGVILQNLLIALAVNDLQEIRREAEFIDKRERIKYIAGIERIIFKKYQNSSQGLFKTMFAKMLRVCNVFQKRREPILVVRPYNNGCVFLKDNSGHKQYIQDQNVMDHLEKIFKNATLQDKDVQESYTLRALHERLQTLEDLIRNLSYNLHFDKKN